MTALTTRAVIIGGLLLIVNSMISSPDRLLVYFLLGVLLLINPLLGRLKQALRFTLGELTVIYIIVIAGSPLFSLGWTSPFMHTRVNVHYYATPENNYARDILPHIKSWFGPASPEAVRGFFEGDMAVPWMEWLPTLLLWGGFTLVLYFTFLCLTALIKDHWLKHERLSFPILKLPLELLEGFKEGKHSLLRNKLTWIGVALPVILHGINGLNHYFPGVPNINAYIDISRNLTEHPWNAIGGLAILLRPMVVGFSYLMSLEVSFSLWFFFMLFKLQSALTAAMAWGGADSAMAGFPFERQQGWGGLLALAAIYFWMMRKHLKDSFVWSFLSGGASRRRQGYGGQARGAGTKVETADDRLPWIGFIGGSIFIVGFMVIAGVSVTVGVIFFALLLINVLVLTRFRAEAGLVPLYFWQTPGEFMIEPVGSKAIGSKNLSVLATFGWTIQDTRYAWMPHMLDGFKLQHEHARRMRSLIAVMLVAALIALSFGAWSMLTVSYKFGANTGSSWVAGEAAAHYKSVSTLIQNPQKPPQPPVPTYFVFLGVALTILLQFLRTHLVWWPFHPIGYVVATGMYLDYNASCFFFGWLARLTIFRLGGTKAYRRYLPFFLGLIMGDLLILGFWDIVGFFVQGAGYYATGY